MRTALLLSLLALTGCASEWKCPKAPKMVATFSVGDHVAFVKFISVWDRRSHPQSFWIDRGDTGKVIDIEYFDTLVRYRIQLDKNVQLFTYANDNHIEAMIYPDPALAPKGKQE